jgi:hypothetical protein
LKYIYHIKIKMLKIKSKVQKLFSNNFFNKYSTKNFASQKGVNICDNPYTLEVKYILI